MKKKGIDFEERYLTSDAINAFKAQGFREAPVVVTDESTWSGFNPSKIDGVLND